MECFQKSPERFLRRHRRRLFLQLWAFFRVEKCSTFLKKKRPFWQLTNDKRVARSVVSITTRKMEKVPVDGRRCESTFSFPLTSRANFLLFLDISAAHSARLLLQLLLWQQKTLSAAICNRRCQLCFSFKKRSCQLFLVKKKRQVWTPPYSSLGFTALAFAMIHNLIFDVLLDDHLLCDTLTQAKLQVYAHAYIKVIHYKHKMDILEVYHSYW